MIFLVPSSTLSFQDGALGQPLLAEKEGAVKGSCQRELAPSSVYLELAVSDHQRAAMIKGFSFTSTIVLHQALASW